MIAYSWVVIILSIVVLIIIAKVAARGMKSDSDFLLASRSLGPLVAACTLMGTYYSGWAFIGSPGIAYRFGYIEIMNAALYIPTMFIVILFFAKFIKKRADQMGSLTIPEYMAQMHGSRIVHGLSAITAATLMMVFLVSQMKAMALLISPILGIPYLAGILLMGGIVILYTASGGLKAVAWTDTIQSIGMMIGALAIFIAVLSVGFGELNSALAKINTELISPTSAAPYGGSKWSILLSFPYSFLGMIATPYLAVRFMAVEEKISWNKMALYMLPLALVWMLVPFAGLVVRAFQPPLAQPDLAMATFLKTYLPFWLFPLMAVFVLFAMQSTGDSVLHNIASTISYDLREVFFPGKFSVETGLQIDRVVVVLFGIIAVVFTIWSPPTFIVFLGQLGIGTMRAAFVGPLLISIFWMGNSIGATSSIIGGGVVAGYCLLSKSLGWMEAPMLGAVVGVVLYFLVSYLTFGIKPRFEPELAKRGEAD